MIEMSLPIHGEPIEEAPAIHRLSEQDLAALVQLHSDANAALMTGDACRFADMLRPTADFSLMAPFGGAPSHGLDISLEGLDRLGRFFRAGTLEVELVASYGTRDLAVLAVIERTDVEVGGLPRQPWALRVTAVYRREANGWRLIHRHADPLRGGISLREAATLASRCDAAIFTAV